MEFPRQDAPRHERQKIWSAVAERSGDTAFRPRIELPKRRGSRSAGFPPQPKILAMGCSFIRVHLCPSVVESLLNEN
jgi:hypothetical protein